MTEEGSTPSFISKGKANLPVPIPISIPFLLTGMKCLTAPCHCSGNKARQLFQDAFEDNYIEIGTGQVIKIN
jgi:hypothetical protein